MCVYLFICPFFRFFLHFLCVYVCIYVLCVYICSCIYAKDRFLEKFGFFSVHRFFGDINYCRICKCLYIHMNNALGKTFTFFRNFLFEHFFMNERKKENKKRKKGEEEERKKRRNK